VAITIDPTVGGPSANSYQSLAEGLAYASTRLGGSKFTDADIETQKAAMVTAVRNIDANVYRGQRVSADQALQFPRANIYLGGIALATDRNPQFVKFAQMEEAIALIEAAGDNVDNPLAATGLEEFRALRVGDINIDMRDPDADNPSRTLLSKLAYRYLQPYLLTQFVNRQIGARNVRIQRG
jgi:hypothetical protein